MKLGVQKRETSVEQGKLSQAVEKFCRVPDPVYCFGLVVL